jgi:hypothetical protein
MEKNHIKKNNDCLSNEESNALENDLKHFGYLLPTNDEELEEFEKIYGITKTLFPEHLAEPDFLFNKKIPGKTDKLSSVQRNKSVAKKEKPSTKKAPVKSIATNSYFRRLVLAAEIATQLHEEPTFGHIKFVKVQYLCEELCNMSLGSNYGKFAAGPLDPKSMYSIDAELKNRRWFSISKTKYGYKYFPDENLNDYKKYYQNYYSRISDKIDSIISLFRKPKSDFCEIVATMFAVWKEKLYKGDLITEDLLINGFYNWSEAKKRFKREDLIYGLAWMNQNGIVPIFQ